MGPPLRANKAYVQLRLEPLAQKEIIIILLIIIHSLSLHPTDQRGGGGVISVKIRTIGRKRFRERRGGNRRWINFENKKKQAHYDTKT